MGNGGNNPAVVITPTVPAGGGGNNPAVVITPTVPENGNPIVAPVISHLSISSTDFTFGNAIPVRFSDNSGVNHDFCSGNNDFPNLTWSSYNGAKSYVIIVEDIAASHIHLNLSNITSNITNIPTTTSDANRVVDLSSIGNVGTNSWSGANLGTANQTSGWSGPCNPTEVSNTVRFKIYAMDIATLPEDLNKTKLSEFESKYGGVNCSDTFNAGLAPGTSGNNILACATFDGTFKKENAGGGNAPVAVPEISPLTISSTDFTNGATIPTNFSDNSGDGQCSGNNDFPNLTWSSFNGAKSYVIIVEDTTNPWVHLNLYNISPNITNIPTTTSGAGRVVNLNSIGNVAENSWFENAIGKTNQTSGWSGPCNPDTISHTYRFKIYAMDIATIPIGDMYKTLITSFENKYVGNACTSTSKGNGVAIPGISESHILACATLDGTFKKEVVVAPEISHLTISSTNFNNGATIPTNFSDNSGDGQCGGNNDFPNLSWSSFKDAKSYVIIVEDTTNPWVHLNLFNISSTITNISGVTGDIDNFADLSSIGSVGRNSWFEGAGSKTNQTTGWSGPCPPAGNAHTYRFKIYAMNIETLPSNLNDTFTTNFENDYGGVNCSDTFNVGLPPVPNGNNNILACAKIEGTFEKAADGGGAGDPLGGGGGGGFPGLPGGP